MGLDGRLNQTPKGTIEVVRVINDHLAQARVTSVKDSKGDPILKGDRLFNPTWDPNKKRRIALAGIADLGGDGADNTEDFRRLLKRQNVDLDAYIDTKDDNGMVHNYRVEMGPPYALVRGGWKRDTIKIGDKVTVEGAALAKDGSDAAGSLPSTSMTLSTGQKMVMR